MEDCQVWARRGRQEPTNQATGPGLLVGEDRAAGFRSGEDPQEDKKRNRAYDLKKPSIARVLGQRSREVLAIRCVLPRHRLSSLGKPRRLIVNISSSSSRSELAALGQSRSSYVAYFWSWAIPSLASSLNAALSVERALVLLGLRQVSQHVVAFVIASPRRKPDPPPRGTRMHRRSRTVAAASRSRCAPPDPRAAPWPLRRSRPHYREERAHVSGPCRQPPQRRSRGTSRSGFRRSRRPGGRTGRNHARRSLQEGVRRPRSWRGRPGSWKRPPSRSSRGGSARSVGKLGGNLVSGLFLEEKSPDTKFLLCRVARVSAAYRPFWPCRLADRADARPRRPCCAWSWARHLRCEDLGCPVRGGFGQRP